MGKKFVWRSGAVIAIAMKLLAGLSVAANAATETVLHSFPAYNNDGDYPLASLINIKGTLYGTTYGGGANGGGTVFSITPGGKEKVLHSFDGSDGAAPSSSLINVKGTLYGTTSEGGAYGYGTVFSVTPGGTETLLHSFDGLDGAYPYAGLINVKGTLYGTTQSGGAYNGCSGGNCGTVFAINPTTGAETVLHSFGGGSDGIDAHAGLISVEGTLYGTTQLGGAYNAGTVFTITPDGKENVLYSFTGADGAYPCASLIDVKGTLYGMTEVGGAYDQGTVFSVTPGGTETVLHSFPANGSNGDNPFGSLISAKGKLYGTTQGGGAYGIGTAFSITTGGKEKVLHSFGANGSDGNNPLSSLINVKGTLYGTTEEEGENECGCGTVFSITP